MVFVTVAQSGSLTKAADQLGYVQSNITARIQHLEASLGRPCSIDTRAACPSRRVEKPCFATPPAF
ncbi:hypothetical protein GCM10025857_39060 [Alicyclobacillus contaminans]|nr:hypothetical protein GCM10025857_39060 [Alicyclobacillus contaminans]